MFAWKNLSGSRLAAHLCWIPPRLAYWLIRGRINFALGLVSALARWGEIRRARQAMAVGQGSWTLRQEAFFRRFQW